MQLFFVFGILALVEHAVATNFLFRRFLNPSPNKDLKVRDFPTCPSYCFRHLLTDSGCTEDDQGCWCRAQDAHVKMFQCLCRSRCTGSDLDSYRWLYNGVCNEHKSPLQQIVPWSCRIERRDISSGDSFASLVESPTAMPSQTDAPNPTITTPTTPTRASSSVSSTFSPFPTYVPPAPQSTGLSTGTKAGIGVGVSLGVLIVFGAGALFGFRRRGTQAENGPPEQQGQIEDRKEDLPADYSPAELDNEATMKSEMADTARKAELSGTKTQEIDGEPIRHELSASLSNSKRAEQTQNRTTQ